MAKSLNIQVVPATSIQTSSQCVLSVAEKQRAERMARARRNILKTLTIVCTCYILCWTWNQVYYMLFNIGIKVPLTAAVSYTGITVAFLNAVINPVIYTAQYRQFQISAKKLFGMKDASGRSSTTTTSVNTMPTVM